jgi:DNA-binding helix-hairpin-helix protein with protein kinase domain
MTTAVYTAARARLTLGPEVARGGEGVVWRVRERPSQVAKLYQPAPPPRAAEKLEAMLARRPADPTAARLGHTAIAWPIEPVFDARGGFLGFLMPGIFDGRPLVDVYNRKRRLQVLPGFDRRYLHRTAANFAAALGALHADGLVVGDLNESNVLVRPNALVTLIDTDSYQVPNLRGRQPLIFPCPVGKTEFTPPELQGRPFAGAVRTPEHDRFALAVLIFQLLMEGSHPFRSRWLGDGEPPSTDQKISLGYFPHSQPVPGPIAPPPGLPPLDVLHPEVAALLRRCFVEGHRRPAKRPLPSEWERVLGMAERTLVRCPNGHLYDGHLTACSWCERPPVRRRTGRPRAVPDGGEAPRQPVPASPVSPPPRPMPVPPVRPRSGRHAWRDAMIASIGTVLIVAMLATSMVGFRYVSFGSDPDPPSTVQAVLPSEQPSTPRIGPARDAGAPFDFAVGDVVRIRSSVSPFFVFQQPDWQSAKVGEVEPETVVVIDGESESADRTIWWPIRDPATGLRGYVSQAVLTP